MSAGSKYPSKKILIPAALVTAAVAIVLGISSANSGLGLNSPIQNNTEKSVLQASSDNTSDYFVLQSQQELFNAVKSGQTEEIFAKIGQAASEIKMASITDYNIITGSDRNNNNNTIRVRFYDPGVQTKPAPLLIYLYGRAGEEINMDFSDPGLRLLANSTGLMVATMDYRFAPFHNSLDDVLSTVRWIHQNSEDLGVDRDRIALGGVSRGANLALSTALVLRDSGNIEDQNLVRVLYLLNGYYSPDLLQSESAKMFGTGTDLITSEDIEMIFDQIHQNESSDYTDPLAFPILSKNLTGLPPVYIVASGIDPVKDESIELAGRLQEEGQEHYLSVWPGVGHSAGSFIFTPVIPETQTYLDSMTVYLRGVLTNSTTTSPFGQKDEPDDYFIFQSQKELFSGLEEEFNSSQQNNATDRPDTETISPEQRRQLAEEGLKSISSPLERPVMASVKDYYPVPGLDGDDIRLRVYDPGVGNKPAPAIVYIFGGGWTIGNVDAFDDSIRRIANSSGMIVAAMDYRLAPENPFPAGLNDVVATVRWIGEHGEELGIDSSKIALGGHSAGANLALSTALVLRDSDDPSDNELVDVLFLVAGPYSPDIISSNSHMMFGQGQFGVQKTTTEDAFKMTFQNTSDYSNPLAFPLLSENLTGLPPVYIAAMSLDPLKDDSLELAERLRKDGQEYYLTIWPGVGHSALVMIPITPETQTYLDSMTVYLTGVLTENKEN
jgi:acetyl esterase